MPLQPSTDGFRPSRRSADIRALPADVLVHILSLLDGPTLASATSASSYLHSLSQPLWRELSNVTWPSTTDPRVSCVLSASFPDAFHSLFSDAFPRLCSIPPPLFAPCAPTDRLLSAVDLHRGGNLIFSRLVETETRSGWFLSSPFRIDALDSNESPHAAKAASSSPAVKSVEGELTLSWVVINPASGRAADFSSRRPVSVQRHWLSGEIQVRFATVLNRFPAGSSEAEPVQVGILVTCEGGEEHVREVSLQVEDLEGTSLNGRDSLVVLQGAMEGHRGKKRETKEEEEGERQRYLEFLERKRLKKEKKMRNEGRLDMACVLIGVPIFAAFWAFVIVMLC
ncbi:probable F-box protein At2g36090 [Aristolochia californica]|uniref:probable F-box protein At2g36090 n=1 Tax=Aristolochia californica TaxID=171875 RepID=UPI0035DAEF2A